MKIPHFLKSASNIDNVLPIHGSIDTPLVHLPSFHPFDFVSFLLEMTIPNFRLFPVLYLFQNIFLPKTTPLGSKKKLS